MNQQQAAALPVYLGQGLGAVWQREKTTFTLWAPTAQRVSLYLFSTGTDEEPGAQKLGSRELRRAEGGVWRAEVEGDQNGIYYSYTVHFPDGRVNDLADPYAVACGANGRRSMVLDLAGADAVPEGWAQDAPPKSPAHARAVWEVHVGDFSADPHSGVPEKWRGKYLAFTLPDTTLDGAGEFATCLNYLKTLGVSHVQLMPIYDNGRLDETKPGQYGWGYDPLNYNVPEGVFSTDPWHGAVRVKECRAMVAALHKAGLRVVMDVVYNHTFEAEPWLEKAVPGYFCRRTPQNTLTNGSGCGNDLASERTMYRKYMVDSVVFWAREYHIDGFRFDLMALHDADAMNAIRAALDQLPGGYDILMYGEPWTGGGTCMDAGARPADKGALDVLSDRIGFFCDDTRDAIKGSAFNAAEPGYVNGGPYHAVRLLHAVDAWRDGAAGFLPKAAQQVVQYVSAHDNFTLWDKLCYTAGTADYDSADETRLAQNRMAAGIYLTCRGLPFLQAGEEFGRTKKGDGNTWQGPQTLNTLDWRRAARPEFAALTEYYRGLFAIRRAWPEISGAGGGPAPILLAMPGWLVGFVLENAPGDEGASGELAVFYNPEPEAQQVALPAGRWQILCDGVNAGTFPLGEIRSGSVTLRPRSVTILRAEERL